MAPDASPNIGHNSMTDAEILQDVLTRDFAETTKRRDDLVAAVGRIPDPIEDEETAGRVVDQIKQIRDCIKIAEAARVDRKAPYLASERLIDNFFGKIKDPLTAAMKEANKKQTAWDVKKEAEELRRREEEERKAKEEAEAARKAAEEAAAKAETETDLEAAIAAEEQANQAGANATRAEKDANARGAQVHVTRGDYGGSSSLRTDWKHRNIDRSKIDLEALRPFLPEDALDKAVRAFIQANKPPKGKPFPKPLAGVDIYEEKTSVVR